MCNMTLNFDKISEEFGINARQYFADEIPRLQPMHDDGLLQITDKGFEVKAPGRLLIRNIAMVFDIYLPKASSKSFSKVI